MDPNACIDELYRILTTDTHDDLETEQQKARAVDLSGALVGWLVGAQGAQPDASRVNKLAQCLYVMMYNHWT